MPSIGYPLPSARSSSGFGRNASYRWSSASGQVEFQVWCHLMIGFTGNPQEFQAVKDF